MKLAIYARTPSRDPLAADVIAVWLQKLAADAGVASDSVVFTDTRDDGRGQPGPGLRALLAQAVRFDAVVVESLDALGVGERQRQVRDTLARVGVRILLAADLEAQEAAS